MEQKTSKVWWGDNVVVVTNSGDNYATLESGEVIHNSLLEYITDKDAVMLMERKKQLQEEKEKEFSDNVDGAIGLIFFAIIAIVLFLSMLHYSPDNDYNNNDDYPKKETQKKDYKLFDEISESEDIVFLEKKLNNEETTQSEKIFINLKLERLKEEVAK